MSNGLDRDPIPRTAFWLGTSGLLPFIVLTGGLYALPNESAPWLVNWLSSYAAVILSFVGAVHWGLALVHPRLKDSDRPVFMAWSVVPALAAWLALLMPPRTGMLLMALTFAVQYAADRQFAQRFDLPAWYLRLRTGLTAVVVLCLLLAVARLAQSTETGARYSSNLGSLCAGLPASQVHAMVSSSRRAPESPAARG
jgi:hypothetical protein